MTQRRGFSKALHGQTRYRDELAMVLEQQLQEKQQSKKNVRLFFTAITAAGAYYAHAHYAKEINQLIEIATKDNSMAKTMELEKKLITEVIKQSTNANSVMVGSKKPELPPNKNDFAQNSVPPDLEKQIADIQKQAKNSSPLLDDDGNPLPNTSGGKQDLAEPENSTEQTKTAGGPPAAAPDNNKNYKTPSPKQSAELEKQNNKRNQNNANSNIPPSSAYKLPSLTESQKMVNRDAQAGRSIAQVNDAYEHVQKVSADLLRNRREFPDL